MNQRAWILPAVLIVLTVSGLVSLGFWQLGRADEKRAIEADIIQAQSQRAELVKNPKDLLHKVHYQVLLEGHYDSDKQFIYDNQIVKGNAGYYVLTPFVLRDSVAILVNRGFVPWRGNRDKLAVISVSEQPTTIQVGLILPQKRIELKSQTSQPTFPILIQSLDLPQLSALSNYQILPILAQLSPQEKHGFFRQWQPFYGSVDKHLGYALQWFLMALVLGFIGLRLGWKNRRA